jgi:DNA-binding response OmpR family regulator
MTSHRQEAHPSSGVGPKKRLRVLCAEDDLPLATVLRYGLEQAGHLVECVGDGRAALDLIASDLSRFDLVVTDHQMPHLIGLDLVKKLRAAGFSGKIIVHCSQLRPVDAAAYRSLAVDHILTKPAQWEELLAAVEKMRAP